MPDSTSTDPQQDWKNRLDLGRLARLQAEIVRADCAAGLFYDPVNIRYATGTSNMQVYALHNPCRYAFVPASGPVTLFEFKGCEHLSNGCPAVGEVRPATAWYHFSAGPRVAEIAETWCGEILELMGKHAGRNMRLAVDRLDPIGTHLLEATGITLVDGQEVAHNARLIKTPEEIDAIRQSVSVCQTGIRRMRDASRAGMSEQEIWALLHQTNIEQGGEWIETRLLTSGPRTNPWYQEAGPRIVEAGDMISVDSDLIGPHGYGADISRSWIVEKPAANDERKRLYAVAREQVSRNVDIFQPGRTFFEVADAAWQAPEPFLDYQQPAIAHGSGLCNEFPLVMHSQWIREKGHDGIILPGMILCVESYVGEPGGREGVKLEQQILVTETGVELLSDMEFEDSVF